MISTVSNGGYSGMMAGMANMQRPSSTQMAENLFAQLDSSNKGYIEKSDLEAAIQGISGTGASSTASIDEVFASLDSDSDGKVTQNEMAASLQKQMEALESQFQDMRMQGGMMPPPPPPPSGQQATDDGFTQDELSTQLSEMGATDGQRAELLTKIVNNFEAADTNSDGKVSFQEAMAYEQSSQTSASSNTAETNTTARGKAMEDDKDAQVMMQIMKLVQAYGLGSRQESGQTLSQSA